MRGQSILSRTLEATPLLSTASSVTALLPVRWKKKISVELFEVELKKINLRTATQKSQYTQHMKSERHNRNSQLKAKRSQSHAHLEDMMMQKPKKSKSEALGQELCKAFMAANILWTKLENNTLKNFL